MTSSYLQRQSRDIAQFKNIVTFICKLPCNDALGMHVLTTFANQAAEDAVDKTEGILAKIKAWFIRVK